MRYFIGITPEPEEQAKIDALRHRFPGKLAQHVEPHITILPPAEYTQASTMEQGLLTALSSTSSFTIQLGTPSYFGKRVLFFSVLDEGRSLQNLRDSVWEEVNRIRFTDQLPIIEDSRAFHPHLTLAMSSFGTPFVIMQQMETEAKVLAESFPPFLVRSVKVYVRDQIGWRTWKILNLKKE